MAQEIGPRCANLFFMDSVSGEAFDDHMSTSPSSRWFRIRCFHLCSSS